MPQSGVQAPCSSPTVNDHGSNMLYSCSASIKNRNKLTFNMFNAAKLSMVLGKSLEILENVENSCPFVLQTG